MLAAAAVVILAAPAVPAEAQACPPGYRAVPRGFCARGDRCPPPRCERIETPAPPAPRPTPPRPSRVLPLPGAPVLPVVPFPLVAPSPGSVEPSEQRGALEEREREACEDDLMDEDICRAWRDPRPGPVPGPAPLPEVTLPPPDIPSPFRSEPSAGSPFGGSADGPGRPDWASGEGRSASPVDQDRPAERGDSLIERIRSRVREVWHCVPLDEARLDPADTVIEGTRDALVDLITVGPGPVPSTPAGRGTEVYRYVGLSAIFGQQDVICRAARER